MSYHFLVVVHYAGKLFSGMAQHPCHQNSRSISTSQAEVRLLLPSVNASRQSLLASWSSLDLDGNSLSSQVLHSLRVVVAQPTQLSQVEKGLSLDISLAMD